MRQMNHKIIISKRPTFFFALIFPYSFIVTRVIRVIFTFLLQTSAPPLHCKNKRILSQWLDKQPIFESKKRGRKKDQELILSSYYLNINVLRLRTEMNEWMQSRQPLKRSRPTNNERDIVTAIHHFRQEKLLSPNIFFTILSTIFTFSLYRHRLASFLLQYAERERQA